MSAPEIPTIDEMQATYDSFCAAVDREDTLGASVYAAVCADHVAKLLKAKPPCLTWQPIESAPKDGTVIIGYDRSNNNADARNYIEFMRWDGERWRDPETYTAKPTHWIPLPEPPEEGEQ